MLLGDALETMSELARALGAPVPTVQREVTRLVEAGVLRTKSVGRARLVTAADDNPAVAPLRQLLLVTFGPPHVIAEEFGDLPGLTEVVLHGSWAARHAGESGPAPTDVDVLLVGRPDPDDVYDAEHRATARLARPVRATVVSEESWAASDLPFLQEVRRRPLLRLPADAAPPVPS